VRKRLVIALAGAAVVTAAAATYYQTTHADTPPAIVTAVLTRGEVVETVEATGTMQAVTTVQVGTQVSGAIKALHADFNSRVRRGQVIAELEPSLFQTQVEQARASVTRLEADSQRAVVQLEDTQRKLRRARELWDGHLIAAIDLEAAEAAVREADASLNASRAQIVQARASLNQAEVNLGHTIIMAPIDGIVISRNVDVGQTVAASMQAPTLFVIARDLTAMQVNASVAESDIGRIAAGQRVSFGVDAYPGELFAGTVAQVRLEPIVEQNVVSYVTTIDVANPLLKLKPGMTANVTIETARVNDVVRVPNASLRVRPSTEALRRLGVQVEPTSAPAPSSSEPGRSAEVWMVTADGIRRVPIRIGITDGAQTAVLSGGLDAGARVVTSLADEAGEPASSSSPLPFMGRPPGTRGTSTTRRPGA
jgi:HlyD family secretion protein